MSVWGHERPIGRVRATSAHPPRATDSRTTPIWRSVPIAAVRLDQLENDLIAVRGGFRLCRPPARRAAKCLMLR